MKVTQTLKNFLQGFIMLNILWYIAAVVINKRVFPKPTEIYLSFEELINLDMGLHVLWSLYRVCGGIGISLLIGVPLGMLMAYSRRWNKVLSPLVYFTYPVPKTALLPVLMLLFGLGDTSKILLIVLIVVFQVIVSVRDSVLNISQDVYSPIRSLGASKPQIFKNITLPAILPELITNIRISIGTALSILFFSEAYGTSYGVGYYIMDAWTRIDYIGMYAGIIIMSLLGFAMFILIDVIEEKLCKWRG
jgi:NitT/TauT family transport system permease protein